MEIKDVTEFVDCYCNRLIELVAALSDGSEDGILETLIKETSAFELKLSQLVYYVDDKTLEYHHSRLLMTTKMLKEHLLAWARGDLGSTQDSDLQDILQGFSQMKM